MKEICPLVHPNFSRVSSFYWKKTQNLHAFCKDRWLLGLHGIAFKPQSGPVFCFFLLVWQRQSSTCQLGSGTPVQTAFNVRQRKQCPLTGCLCHRCCPRALKGIRLSRINGFSRKAQERNQEQGSAWNTRKDNMCHGDLNWHENILTTRLPYNALALA